MNNTPPTTDNINPEPGVRRTIDTGAASLWASLFVIAALVVMQASKLGSGNAAYAGDVANVGQLTALTTIGGPNEEILYLLDKSREKILVYGVQGGRSVELYQVEDLEPLYTQAKAAAGGTRR
ncbi:MAG TPA: hypothetical protein VG797_03630 [Phycisphaerales bacterium]|nr:hypothetical protein [Phycisphaerales bacterium]